MQGTVLWSTTPVLWSSPCLFPLPPSPPFPAARLLTEVQAAKGTRRGKNNTLDLWHQEGKHSPLPLSSQVELLKSGQTQRSCCSCWCWLRCAARLPGLLTGIHLEMRARARGKAGLGWGLINNNSPSAHCINIY